MPQYEHAPKPEEAEPPTKCCCTRAYTAYMALCRHIHNRIEQLDRAYDRAQPREGR